MAVQIQTPKKKCPPGLPGWLATFGDLMSLLLCFFVLLLSFATIDARKMKKVITGMEKAFGVQDVIPTPEQIVPMGTSIITDKFSPNVTKRTTKEMVRQETTDSRKRILDQKQGARGEREDDAKTRKEIEIESDTQVLEQELRLETFIRSAEVIGKEEMLMVRLKDKAAFKTGKADLNKSILPVLKKVSRKIAGMRGRIVIVGHTDNVPISNDEFSSNWELSTRRATAVLHKMVEYTPELAPRIQAEGHAAIDPIGDNRDPMGRSLNRRVEIVLRK